jgi:hypothetical protein
MERRAANRKGWQRLISRSDSPQYQVRLRRRRQMAARSGQWQVAGGARRVQLALGRSALSMEGGSSLEGSTRGSTEGWEGVYEGARTQGPKDPRERDLREHEAERKKGMHSVRVHPLETSPTTLIRSRSDALYPLGLQYLRNTDR